MVVAKIQPLEREAGFEGVRDRLLVGPDDQRLGFLAFLGEPQERLVVLGVPFSHFPVELRRAVFQPFDEAHDG